MTCAAFTATSRACPSHSLFPVLFLVIFGSVFQHQNVAVPGGRIDEPTYYVPGIIAYGLIAAAFSNLVVSVVRYRETGIYKRRRAAPLPASAVIAGT
jgi:ABC-2 type transport system permease protein